MKQWYEELFQDYGKTYDNENFTHGTIGECNFIEKETGFNKDAKILDTLLFTSFKSVCNFFR